MRLFTAILFDENIKDDLYDTVRKLQNLAEGNFTLKDNLHLTLNFIGETDRLEAVKQVMDHSVNETRAKQIELSIQGLGKFKRREGDIYWIGVDKEDTLWKIQRDLAKKLIAAGFTDVEDREYTPHLTLGRKVCV